MGVSENDVCHKHIQQLLIGRRVINYGIIYNAWGLHLGVVQPPLVINVLNKPYFQYPYRLVVCGFQIYITNIVSQPYLRWLIFVGWVKTPPNFMTDVDPKKRGGEFHESILEISHFANWNTWLIWFDDLPYNEM